MMVDDKIYEKCEKLADKVKRGRWLCLLCKSDIEGRHGTLDDGKTPCPQQRRIK